MEKVGILVIDDDAANQTALQQILDSENWQVQPAPQGMGALQEIATGRWTLVIASIGTTGFSGPLFQTLRELALAPVSEDTQTRLRVLFVVPEDAASQSRSALESEHLPYIQKPYNLHDLLERVSDLLIEMEAIAEPIRRVREQGLLGSRNYRAGQSVGASRNTGMFANREDYGMTEEEIAEYERNEAEEIQRKRKKRVPGYE